MGKGEQIDKMSKKYLKLSSREVRNAKKIHKKYLRKISKDINAPNPQSNRYSGWIG